MSGPLLRLLTAWRTVLDRDADPLDALDAAWLAAHTALPRAPEPDAPAGPAPENLPGPAAGSGQSANDDEPEPEPESEPLPPTPAPERDQPAPEPVLEESEAGDEPGGDGGGPSTGGADLHLPRAKSAGSGGGGRGFAAPAAPALPRPLELARALRPLARRVPSRSRFVLDVVETVRRYATERLWVPALRPARERWLRVALIVDSKGGAVVWRDTVGEFRALLTGLGAFRHVRAWHLDTAAPKPVLSVAPGGPPRAPRELIDPTGRTLVIVLTTAVAAGWYTGDVRAALAPLAARGPVLLLPLLPERLWPRTALARAAPIDVTAPTAGCPNAALRARRAGPFADEPPPPGLAVPVAVLDPGSLRRWADLVAGAPGATAPGFVLCDGPAPTALMADLSPSDRVRRFRAASSPEAQRFAGLLAASPVLNLAVLRLVRAALCRECGQPHEAEVLTSGLLTRAEGDTDDADPRFDFVEGARDLLLDATPTDATLAVLGAVSDYLNARLPSGRTFRAVLSDPRSAEGELVDDGAFAHVAAAVLTRVGGAHARVVRRGKPKILQPKTTPTQTSTPPRDGSTETPEVTNSPEFVEQVAVLVAVTSAEVTLETSRPADPIPRYRRVFAIPANKLLSVGRGFEADLVIPQDLCLAKRDFELRWLPHIGLVRARSMTAQDRIETVAQVGDTFKVGQTVFGFYADTELLDSPDVSVTRLLPPVSVSEEQAKPLEEIPFANPAAALKALEQIPSMIRAANNERAIFRQLLKVVMDAMPRADAAAIVRIPANATDSERRLTHVESNVRPKLPPSDGSFLPSGQLTHLATLKRRSVLCCWSPEDTDPDNPFLTKEGVVHGGMVPWAICTPFQDGTRYALYIAGQALGQWNLMNKAAQDKLVLDLTQYQKIAELIVGVIETTLRVARLTQQNKLIRRAWPQMLWKFLDDPDALEQMLAPKEMEITPLLCDLREYGLRAARTTDDLVGAQQQLSKVREVIGGAITDRDGVVGGFHGDTVFGFWGWPRPDARQVELAAKAALALVSRLSAGAPFGVVVTHGTAVAGRLGGHENAIVDAFGPVVNLTHRLEHLRRVFDVTIVVSEEVAFRLAQIDPHRREFVTRRLGLIQRQGFPEPLWVYELTSPTSPSGMNDFLLTEWETGVTDFTEGRWTEAYEHLTGTFADDPAARCLLRVMDRFDHKRPADWTGAFTPIDPPGSDP